MKTRKTVRKMNQVWMLYEFIPSSVACHQNTYDVYVRNELSQHPYLVHFLRLFFNFHRTFICLSAISHMQLRFFTVLSIHPIFLPFFYIIHLLLCLSLAQNANISIQNISYTILKHKHTLIAFVSMFDVNVLASERSVN